MLVNNLELPKAIYEPIAPELVPLAVAKTVNLGLQVAPPVKGKLTIPLGALREMFDLARAGEAERAKAAMRQGKKIGDPWANALYQMASQCRLFWQVTSFWNDHTGAAHITSVSVIDAGPAGLWHIEPDAEVKEVAENTFMLIKPTDSSTVWNQIIDRLPSSRKIKEQ